MSFHDFVKNFFFKTSKESDISPQIIEFKNLEDSEVLSSNFPGLRNLSSLIDLCSLCNLTGLNSLLKPNFLIKLPDPDSLIISGTKITGNSLRNVSSKIQFFTNIWHRFCRRPRRPCVVKKVSNGGSGINFHYSGSH